MSEDTERRLPTRGRRRLLWWMTSVAFWGVVSALVMYKEWGKFVLFPLSALVYAMFVFGTFAVWPDERPDWISRMYFGNCEPMLMDFVWHAQDPRGDIRDKTWKVPLCANAMLAAFLMFGR